MAKKMVTRALVLLLVTQYNCAGGCIKASETRPRPAPKADAVDEIIERLRQKTKELKTYEGQIEYVFSQPDFESRIFKSGLLYYSKSDKRSHLRMNFQTLKQDDDEQQQYIEHFIFDGIWLTHIDYQIRQVNRYQRAEPNEPVDALELARQNFPIIGFGETEDLKKDFQIELLEPEAPEQEIFAHLRMAVKPDSVYRHQYSSIEFWIDKKLYLPAKIVATTMEADIYEIRFINPKINEPIDRKVFEFKVPQGFGEEKIPLERKSRPK